MNRQRNTRAPRSAPRGFTLLEAIVALVLMATTLISLYTWLAANTIAISRAQASTAALMDARAGLALVESVNPMQEPSGERELGPLTVRWTSEPVVEPQPGLSRAGLPTLFRIGLYRMSVDVLRGPQVVRTFEVRRTGWEQVQSVSPEDW